MPPSALSGAGGKQKGEQRSIGLRNPNRPMNTASLITAETGSLTDARTHPKPWGAKRLLLWRDQFWEICSRFRRTVQFCSQIENEMKNPEGLHRTPFGAGLDGDGWNRTTGLGAMKD